MSASYAVKPRFQLSVLSLQLSVSALSEPFEHRRHRIAESRQLSVENLCTNSAFAVDGLSSEIFFQDDAAETRARRYRDGTFVNGFA